MKLLQSIPYFALLCSGASAAPVVLYETGWEPAPASPAWVSGAVAPQNGWQTAGASAVRHRVLADGSADATVFSQAYTTPYGSQFMRFTASSSTTANNGQWSWIDITAAFAARPAGHDRLVASMDVLVPSGDSADTSNYGLQGYSNGGNTVDFQVVLAPAGRAMFLGGNNGAELAQVGDAFPYDTWFNLAIQVNYQTGELIVLTNGVPVPGLSATEPLIVGSLLEDVDLFCVNDLTPPNPRVIFTDNYRIIVEPLFSGPPENDNFANAFLLPGQSGQTNGATSGATAEVGEPEHAALSPVRSVWYEWIAPASGSFTFDTLNSSLNTILAVYTGSTVDGLAEVASNDDVGGGIVQSRVTFQATANTTYRIAVDSATAGGNFALRWRPTFHLVATRQPDNHLRLTITAAIPGFVELQESGDLSSPLNWSTFDSVEFTGVSGGSVDYDAGDVSSPARRFFRTKQ